MSETDVAAPPAEQAGARDRHRPTHFTWHGDRFSFNRLEDGVTLARLDPYCERPQKWRLLSGWTIHVTGADVRDISRQVHFLELPDTRPEALDYNDLANRLAKLETERGQQAAPDPVIVEKTVPDPADKALIDTLRAENEALKAREPEIKIVERVVEKIVEAQHTLQSRPDTPDAGYPEYGPGGTENSKERDDLVTSESFRELKDEVSLLVRDRMANPDHDDEAKDKEIERLQAELEAALTKLEEENVMREIDIRGVKYMVSSKDALALVGAFIVNLARDPAQLSLESGQSVEVTIDDIEHIGRQLAGKEP